MQSEADSQIHGSRSLNRPLWATTPSSVPVSLFRRTAKVRTKRVLKLAAEGKKKEEIAEMCGITVEEVAEILE